MNTKQKVFLKPSTIFKYLKGQDADLDSWIMTREDLDLSTSDQNLYEAVGSFEDRQKLDINRFVKFLERVNIHSHVQLFKEDRKVLTHERVDEIVNDKESDERADSQKGV
ncbi:MAG: hypothetical protein ABIH41_02410 [Nanoarchaeota archaeon]